MTNQHGGKREGAGRPATGTTKKVSITLADETWTKLEQTKQDENSSQSAVLRSIVEEHYNKPIANEREAMWWELVRKYYFEGFIEIKKSMLHACIEHRHRSKEFEAEVWQRCIENSKSYKKPRVNYLLEAFYFEGKRLLFDENFADREEQVIFAIMEHVRLNRIK